MFQFIMIITVELAQAGNVDIRYNNRRIVRVGGLIY